MTRQIKMIEVTLNSGPSFWRGLSASLPITEFAAGTKSISPTQRILEIDMPPVLRRNLAFDG